jgi:hypothetical protein
MWRLVDVVWTDVSEECIASIFMVEKSDRVFLYPEDGDDTFLRYIGTRRHIPEDGILHSHRHESLKF